jgi:hypothetical protein
VLFFPGLTSTPEVRRAFAQTGDIFDDDGVSPFSDYVIRERGKVEVGDASCRECYARLMPDATVIRGAQGNRPIEQIAYFGLAADAAKADDKDRFLADAREGQRRSYAAPWLKPDPNARLERFSAAEIEAVNFAIPPGVFARQGTVATLEDWFDPRRLRSDYVPTGWKGYGVTTRAVPGHEYGLQLSAEGKRALIAFLKTL